MSEPRQMRLGAQLPGLGHATGWSGPGSDSGAGWSAFERFAQTAELAKLDFIAVGEDLSLDEHAGQIDDLNATGRPDGLAALAALAAVTERVGLAATLTTTYREPLELARQLATLDHLSGGRAAWNLVSSTDVVSGANFRRGAFLPSVDRYLRAAEALALADELWTRGPGPFAVHGGQVELSGTYGLDATIQRRPVVIQTGDSDAGREFAARHADVIVVGHASLADAQQIYADVKGRLANYGRAEDDLLVVATTTVVLGDTDDDAAERAAAARAQRVSGPRAIVLAEQLWNRDLSDYDPDGPLPDVDPVEGEVTIAAWSKAARDFGGRRAQVIDELRARAEAERWSLRDAMIATRTPPALVGTAATIADRLESDVRHRAADGFVLNPDFVPGGLDEFAQQVVPLLQERGAFRADYDGETLREHLGLR